MQLMICFIGQYIFRLPNCVHNYFMSNQYIFEIQIEAILIILQEQVS